MATNKPETTKAPENAEMTKAPENEGKVKVDVPRGIANDDPNGFVGVNGVNYVFPKGETVELPAAAAAELQRAERAKRIQDKNIDAMPKAE